MHICLHIYCSSKASWKTFEAIVLEKRCWNGTKARLGAAWWGDTEERPPPSSTDEEEQGLIALKPQRPASKGEDENSGRGILCFHLEMRHDRWPAWRSHAFQNYSHPRYQDLSALMHTHTDLICFPSPCGDWNIHISHKPTHTFSNCWISFTRSLMHLHTLSFPHLTFSPSSQKLVKGRVSVWLKWALSAAFPISHSCVKAFCSSSPSLFLLLFCGGKAKRKINTFSTFCLRFITQPQSGAGESAKS